MARATRPLGAPTATLRRRDCSRERQTNRRRRSTHMGRRSTRTMVALIVASAGLALFSAVAFAATVIGTNHNDRLTGTPANDTIRARAGNDRVFALAGDDLVFGGLGRDRIQGDRGNDTLNGGDGRDRIRGGQGADNISGDRGNDRLFGGDDNDVVNGYRGADFIVGGRGDDDLWALARGDVAFQGDPIGDTLVGENGDDTFHVRDGEVDRVDCGAGNDTVQADQYDLVDGHSAAEFAAQGTNPHQEGNCERVIRRAPAPREDSSENATQAPKDDSRTS